jgi:hypothetical protein
MNRLSSYRVELLLSIVLLFLLFLGLFAHPIVGLSDNGDFGRMMATGNLIYPYHAPEDQYFSYFTRNYMIDLDGKYWSTVKDPYFSTQALFVKTAIGLNIMMHPVNSFDLAVMGYMYTLLFAGIMFGLWVALSKTRVKHITLMMILSIIMFTDVAYVSFFNSFYSEAASYIFLFAWLGVLVYLIAQAGTTKPGLFAMLLFYFAVGLFTAAKTQNAVFGVVLALYAFRFMFLRKDLLWRFVIGTCSIVLVILSIYVYKSNPKFLERVTLYDSVFYGILLDSPTPDKDLHILGVDERYVKLKGTTYFMYAFKKVNQDEFNRNFFDVISRGKIVKFYATHPSRLINKTDALLKDAAEVRNQDIGNFRKEDGYPPRALSHRLTVWSDLKRSILPGSIWFAALYFTCYFAVIIITHFKSHQISKRMMGEISAIIGIMCIANLYIQLFGEGENDAIKHLFLYNVLFDITLIISCMWVINMAVAKIKRLFNKHASEIAR